MQIYFITPEMFCSFKSCKMTQNFKNIILVNPELFHGIKKKNIFNIQKYNFTYTVCNIFTPIFPIWITCYSPMRTINFGKYLRLFQIKPIKTVEFRFIQIGKMGAKMLQTVLFTLIEMILQKVFYL